MPDKQDKRYIEVTSCLECLLPPLGKCPVYDVGDKNRWSAAIHHDCELPDTSPEEPAAISDKMLDAILHAFVGDKEGVEERVRDAMLKAMKEKT